MFLREKVSDAAAKTAMSRTPAARASSKPAHVRHEHGIAHVRARARCARAHRRCPPSAAPIWAKRSCRLRSRARPVRLRRSMSSTLISVGDGLGFVLQAVARTDLNQLHGFGERHRVTYGRRRTSWAESARGRRSEASVQARRALKRARSRRHPRGARWHNRDAPASHIACRTASARFQSSSSSALVGFCEGSFLIRSRT